MGHNDLNTGSQTSLTGQLTLANVRTQNLKPATQKPITTTSGIRKPTRRASNERHLERMLWDPRVSSY